MWTYIKDNLILYGIYKITAFFITLRKRDLSFSSSYDMLFFYVNIRIDMFLQTPQLPRKIFIRRKRENAENLYIITLNINSSYFTCHCLLNEIILIDKLIHGNTLC